MKSQKAWLMVASFLMTCTMIGCEEKQRPVVTKPKPIAEKPESAVSKPDVAEEPKPATKKPEVAEWQLPPGAPRPAIAPFDADQAKEHQQAWAEYLRVSVEITNSIGMKLMLIPAGEFTMGSAESDDYAGEEKPQHRTKITKAFCLGKYEVTRGQYRKVMGKNLSRPDAPAPPSWTDAQEFCRKLSALAEEKKAGRRYRLPTEAEWEYACRAGSTTKWCFGDDVSRLGDYAWHKGNSDFTMHEVGQKQPNAWCLYDVYGNVWEWCADWYDSGYYANSPKDDPTGPPAGTARVIRGGGWMSAASECRSAFRDALEPQGQGGNVGFRVAVDPSGE